MRQQQEGKRAASRLLRPRWLSTRERELNAVSKRSCNLPGEEETVVRSWIIQLSTCGGVSLSDLTSWMGEDGGWSD